MPAPALTPSAVLPVPPEFDVEARIQMLEGMIQDPNTKEDQKSNLHLAIDLYKREELPKFGLVYFQDGKITTLPELHGRSSWWLEGIGRQFSQKLVDVDYSSKEQENFHQLGHRVAYPYSPLVRGHEIFARMRPVPGWGSPTNPMDITMMNDTGSDLQTVYPPDLTALGVGPNYQGYGPQTMIQTANGQVLRVTITVEVQLLTAQGTVVSDWIRETGAITPAAGAPRLSGLGIRDFLYFATAPGNQTLFVAEKKNGIVDQLPAV